MKSLNIDPFKLYNNEWALVTAGNMDDYNTMTISWGGVGTIWGKSVVTVYIKPIRHTYGYVEKNEYFTVSFFPDEYHEDLVLLGSRSGRDGDKVAQTKLTPAEIGGSVGFKEAKLTFLCKKLYAQDLDGSKIPTEALERFYVGEAPHRMYIAEVVDII